MPISPLAPLGACMHASLTQAVAKSLTKQHVALQMAPVVVHLAQPHLAPRQPALRGRRASAGTAAAWAPCMRRSARCRVQASAWGSAPEPFVQPQQLPLSAIADARQQLQAAALDDWGISSSMRGFERQFEQMDRAFADMDRLMDRQMRQMDADMDRMTRQLESELARSMREQQPGVRIERREERAPGSYRYYESIQIHGGSQPMAVLTPAHSNAPALTSPLLLAAVVAAGAWAALTAALARNYDLTTYKASRKWQLLLLWPLLLPLSPAFRAQFISALRGEKVRVLDSIDGGGSSGE